MLDWDGQEKTEQPTQTRREEARQQGSFPRSLDLTVATSLLASFCAAYLLGPRILESSCRGLCDLLGQVGPSASGLSPEAVRASLAQGAAWLASVVLPVGLVAAAIAVLAMVVQIGPALRIRAPSFDLARLSPRRGIARILSLRSVARGSFATVKIFGAGALAAWALVGTLSRHDSLGAPGDPGALRSALSQHWSTLCRAGLRISLLLVAIALLDVLYQRWQHGRELRMSRSEVEEEAIRLEGNREHKARVRKEAAALKDRAGRSKLEGGSA